MELIKKIAIIQSELKAPKGQYNSFGKYNYRSCEDILESVKPLLAKHGLVLTIQDGIELIGDRYYVKAIVMITDGSEDISTIAYARESHDKKGMDESQITGAASSYARKYALSGMFCIDDTKDADSVEDKPLPQNTAYNWKTLKARATQGGVTEEALKDYLKNELKVKNTEEMTRDHYQKAFDFINNARYKK